MADAAVATPGTSASVVIRCIASEGTVDVPNNRSYLYVDLYLVVTAYNGANGPFRTSPADSYGYVDSSVGLMIANTRGYDLRQSVASSIHWGSYAGWIPHLPDGTRTVTLNFGFNGGGGTPLGNGSGSMSITLTPIAQASLERYDGSSFKKSILERYDGSGWKRQILERYDGSSWKRQG